MACVAVATNDPYLQPGKQIQQLLHTALTCTEQYAHRNKKKHTNIRHHI